MTVESDGWFCVASVLVIALLVRLVFFALYGPVAPGDFLELTLLKQYVEIGLTCALSLFLSRLAYIVKKYNQIELVI